MAVLVGWRYWAEHESSITTAVGEQRSLTLTDGTRIYLNTDTRLFVHETERQRRVQLESGEALFDVAQDPQRPFVVTAGNREIMALGTSFVIRRDPRQLVVTLMEGKVAVTADGARTQAGATVMTPGQRITFTERAVPRLDAPTLETVTAWRRGEVVLDRTRLQDAVSEMNRYSAVKLRIDDPRVENILVSGIFRAGDSARFARAVAETYHLSVEEERQVIVIDR
jgi:transmembrane sensor